MIWLPVSPYADRTSCDTYRVCRVSIDGRWLYEAWRGRECIARSWDADSAPMRGVCEADLRDERRAA